MPRPLPTDHAPYFARYISLVQEDEVKAGFENQTALIKSFFSSISQTKAGYAYAEGKWTIQQLMQHLIDAERIFSYRALWIARKGEAPLPGFDENAFAELAHASNRTIKELTDELLAVRASTKMLFDSLSNEELQFSGISNTHPATVNAIGFITLGHIIHHKAILEERYL
jgi:uncharacterized damage-inducible protein DinB